MSHSSSPAATLGYVHSVETFGLVDGPGVRYVLFFAGLPDALPLLPQPRDLGLFPRKRPNPARQRSTRPTATTTTGKTTAGWTVSGGEPLLQIDLSEPSCSAWPSRKACTTALDTCGQPFTAEGPFYEKFRALMQYTDLVLLDIKEWDQRPPQGADPATRTKTFSRLRSGCPTMANRSGCGMCLCPA